ncbi:ankyrin repeat domain-containing protein [Arsukibacterium indicum]|uniref:Ankyrin repeat domain-containing protein n=1 Tax=Arsukibacterium indicum TaxID=2848612 RepID=A0ABS6MLP5_9GAMM|nr:ankyrin repeat domain-containing protein [Arsukibacterium indicum]MBV2129741.1 ankyrin repeat domain-containing protein [Arsukibacterium indicum]
MSKNTLTQDELTEVLHRRDAADRISWLIKQKDINPDLLRFGQRKLPLLNELLCEMGNRFHAIQKNVAVAIALLNAGVNPQKIQRDKFCPLSLACQSVRMDAVLIEPLIHALLQAGAKPEVCKQPHLLFVCGMISESDRSGYLSSPIDGYGNTPVDPAKKQALINIITALVANGADIDAFDKYHKYNPLMLLVQTPASCIVEDVLVLGANVNIANAAGNTPLLFACGDVEVSGLKENRNVEVVRRLLAAGADPAVTNRNGRTPLSVASKNGYHDICYALYQELQARGQFYADDRKYFKDSPYKDKIDVKAKLAKAPEKTKRKPEGQAESWPAAAERLYRNYPESRLGELLRQLTSSDSLIDVRQRLFADTYCDSFHIGKTKKLSYVAGTITLTDNVYDKYFTVSFEREGASTLNIPLTTNVSYSSVAQLPIAEVQSAILAFLPGLE